MFPRSLAFRAALLSVSLVACASDAIPAAGSEADAGGIVDAAAGGPDAGPPTSHLPAFCAALPGPPPGAGQWESTRVRYHEGRLVYTTDAAEHRIPDYSFAGYHHGELAPPRLVEVARVGPGDGDDTARIQAAIDDVAAREPDDGGFRGAVVLDPGRYEIAGTVRVNAHGIVLRGSGDGDDPTRDTILVATGDEPHQRTVVVVGSGDGNRNWRENGDTRVEVTADFVPVSSMAIPVDDASGFEPGARVLVRHPSSEAWIEAVDGGGTINDPPWSPGSVDAIYVRRVVGVEANTLRLDAPIYNHLDRRLSVSTVAEIDRPLVAEVGVEDLRIDIVTAGGEDENHAWNAVGVVGAEDAWVRNVTALHFGYAGVVVTMAVRVTVEDVRALDPVAIRTGGRMYNFTADHGAQLVLFSHCEATNGRHGYITNGTSSASGIVFWRGRASRGGGSEAGHRHWAQGILYDNLVEEVSGQVLLMNRGDAGSSHGWGAAHSTVWNYNSEMVVQQPPTAQNYAVSQAGHLRSQPYNPGAIGHVEIAEGELVPGSLYEAQLCERLR